MPADVQNFMVRYQGCQHWLGEPDSDAERRRQIERAVADVCPGIDAAGARLRARYADNPAVLGRLRDYQELGQ